MPRGKKGKKSGPRSELSRGGNNPPVRGSSAKSRGRLAHAAATTPRKETQGGRRSKTSSGPLRDFQDDPERILRKRGRPRRVKELAQVQDRPESQSHGELRHVAQSVEISHAEQQQHIDRSALDDYSEEASSSLRPDTDPEQIFYRSWGYLPPLDEDAVAVIEAIMADPSKAKDHARISPENLEFNNGLKHRNVFLTPSMTPDPYADVVEHLKTPDFIPETAEDRKSHGQLWSMDRAKCNKGSNEALFQRTLMMSLIARHHWIYHAQTINKHHLEYSVEETWTCPPMPTRAYSKGAPFLTQPKPDLAVCFCRGALIPDYLWNEMPSATQRLACFESAVDEVKMERVFHFFTIEAKKGETSPDDSVGKRQSLNNASQALHNMFEFFRDAGTKHEEIFFNQVRFFSGVASPQGLTLRMHRATREPSDGSDQGFIMKDKPEYPLRFEHRVISEISKKEFDRNNVYEKLERILLGYGIGELHTLLHNAAEALMERLSGSVEMDKREDKDFYRYGQTEIKPTSRMPTSRIPTPSLSRAQSKQFTPAITPAITPKRRPGRPSGSRSEKAPTRGRGRPRKDRSRAQSDDSYIGSGRSKRQRRD